MDEDELIKAKVPKDMKGICACSNCGLVLTNDQFNAGGCPNECDYEEEPTSNFSGIIAVIDPKVSWVA